MNLNIKITTNNSCKVIVEDISEYLPEDFTGISKGKFKYSDTMSIDILLHNKTDETVYTDPIYTSHNMDSISIPVKFDGWFDVVHIVIPTKEWFNKLSEALLGIYNIVYFCDGNNIYKYINNKITQVTIDEILEVNPIDTTISKTNKEYVSICFLKKCYISLCLQIFNERGFSSCWNKNNIDSELIYKRDLVWMAINVIKYLTECNQLAEVERILEIIHGCNGLCSSSNVTSKTNGCGCSK